MAADQPNDRLPVPTNEPADDGAAAPEVWHRVHPLTPILESLGVLVGIFVAAAYGLQNFFQRAVENLARGDGVDLGFAGWLRTHPLVIFGAVGGILFILLLTALFSWLAWRVMGYRIDSEAIYYRRGLLSKKQRKARLDRVQSIDLQQKLLPRLLGMAELVFDVAGGSDSNISLKYLSKKRAEGLRDELLSAVRATKQATQSGQRTANGGQSAEAAPGTEPSNGSAPGDSEEPDVVEADMTGDAVGNLDGDPAIDRGVPERRDDSIGVRLSKRLGTLADGVSHEAESSINELLAPYNVSAEVSEEGEIIRVPVHRVVVSSLLRTETIISVLAILLVAGAAIFLLAMGFIEAFIPMLVGVIPAIFTAFSVFKKNLDNANFVVKLGENGLAVNHGLVSTSRKVIPLDRLQAVCLHQPLLWRWAGWWKVEYNIASAGDSGESNILLPVGDIDQALLMVGLALPDPQLPDDLSAATLVRSAMYDRKSEDPQAESAEALFHGQPRSSRLIDPLVWKRRAYAVTGSLLVLRLGVLDRRVDFVPHVRVQSMSYHQGPLMRSLGLGTVAVHSTAGPIDPRVTHQSVDDAKRFFSEHSERTRVARQRYDEEARRAKEGRI
ncbi:MAG: PH domain-containing protein [Brevibacterium sp.]|uniref:PH domain-containing protein n=1 Tax=Brevibacterium sandarakinum TaxID=629680 RepID=UPI00264DF5D7|nr:PH domain-containing protein [Brevibacterium sandarakinum]MDN5585125.1 PH domain-containing protein [Brevibacterium sp.]MDN5656788.1 PH domain-containing protein [Brevibacterium sandarakinum]